MNNHPFQHRGYDLAPFVLTLVTALPSGDTQVRINPAKINVVKADPSGSVVWHQDGQGFYVKSLVSETPSAIIALGLPLVEVVDTLTPETVWIPVGNIGGVRIGRVAGSSLMTVYADKNGNSQEREVAVVPSVFIAAMEAAVAAVSPGSQIQVIAAAGATQGTATQITSSSASITSGAVDTGVILPVASLMGEVFITNQSGTEKFIYPAVGEAFEGLAANEPQSIPEGESVNLKYADTAWVAEDSEFMQKVAASGTVQGGGQIKENVQTAYVISVVPFANTAVTLPPAKAGTDITIHQLSVVTAQLFPGGTDQIYGLGAGIKTPILFGQSISLQCTVDGSWEDKTSQVDTISVNNIKATAAGGTVSIQETNGTPRVEFNQNNTTFLGGMNLQYLPIVATGALATANGTLIRITTCGTEGHGIILGATHNNSIKVRNDGAETAFIYPPVGLLMNGVVDGPYPLTRGASAEFITDGSGGWNGSISDTGKAHEVTATGAGTSILNPNATITTVGTFRDKVQLNSLFKRQTIVNAGSLAAEVLAPTGEFINGATSTFVLIQPGSINEFRNTAAGTWVHVVTDGLPQIATAAIPGTLPVITSSEAQITTTGAGEEAMLGDDTANSGSSVVGQSVIFNISANSFLMNAAAGSGFIDLAVGGAASATFTFAANTAYQVIWNAATTTYWLKSF